MVPAWLSTIAIISLVVCVACALLIVGDIVAGRRQPMAVMNFVWPITALYLGPIGLWAYWSLGRPKANKNTSEGGGESHGKHTPDRPFWQTVFLATSHCGAGCTLGDTIAEWALFLLGVTLFGSKLLTAFAFDFTLAFLFGIIFQFFTIAPMRNLGVREGIIAALKADTISLIAFEVGMFGWMALDRLVFFTHPPEPNSAAYWFLMQIAMIVGFATSYPANWFLVRSGIKEAM